MGGAAASTPQAPKNPSSKPVLPVCNCSRSHSQDKFPFSRCLFFFPVLHILQVHEIHTFQLSSSTEKWSEVFLSEGIFLSDELSLQPRSPYQRGSDAGLSLVRVRRALQPQLEQAGREGRPQGSLPTLWGQPAPPLRAALTTGAGS